MFKSNISLELKQRLGNKIYEPYIEDDKIIDEYIYGEYKQQTIIVFRYAPFSDSYSLIELTRTFKNDKEVWSKGYDNLNKLISLKPMNLKILNRLRTWGLYDMVEIVLSNRGISFRDLTSNLKKQDIITK